MKKGTLFPKRIWKILGIKMGDQAIMMRHISIFNTYNKNKIKRTGIFFALSLVMTIAMPLKASAKTLPASSPYYLGFGVQEGITYQDATKDREKIIADETVLDSLADISSNDEAMVQRIASFAMNGGISENGIKYLLAKPAMEKYAGFFMEDAVFAKNADESGNTGEGYSATPDTSISSDMAYRWPESHIEGHTYPGLTKDALEGAVRQMGKYDVLPDVYLNIPRTCKEREINGKILNETFFSERDLIINFTDAEYDSMFYGWRFSNWLSPGDYVLPLGIKYNEEEIAFDADRIINNNVQIWLLMEEPDMNYNIYSKDGYECSIVSDKDGYITFWTDDLTSYRLTKGTVEAGDGTGIKKTADILSAGDKSFPMNTIMLIAGILMVIIPVIYFVIAFLKRPKYY